jgi:DNA-binding CsgD family transcriptional regulator
MDSVTLRVEVAERLKRAVGFDAHAFGTADPATGLLTHLVAERMPAALELEYVDELYPLHGAAYVNDAARRGELVFRAGSESPELVEAERKHGFRFGLEALLVADGSLWGKWCLLRETRGEAASRERGLLKRLLPHLGRGLQQAALVDAAFSGDARPHAASGVLLLDDRGRPLVRSPAVSAMLADLADIGVAFDAGIPLSILTLAKQCRTQARRAGDGVPETLTLRSRGQSGRWYLVQASVAEMEADASPPTVVVVRPMLPRELAPMLTALYGLSPREREIIAAVVRGDTTKEIARRLSISPHTVKHHLDRACAKTGARGRRELIARLFRDAYRPTLTAAIARRPPARA